MHVALRVWSEMMLPHHVGGVCLDGIMFTLLSWCCQGDRYRLMYTSSQVRLWCAGAIAVVFFQKVLVGVYFK